MWGKKLWIKWKTCRQMISTFKSFIFFTFQNGSHILWIRLVPLLPTHPGWGEPKWIMAVNWKRWQTILQTESNGRWKLFHQSEKRLRGEMHTNSNSGEWTVRFYFKGIEWAERVLALFITLLHCNLHNKFNWIQSAIDYKPNDLYP